MREKNFHDNAMLEAQRLRALADKAFLAAKQHFKSQEPPARTRAGDPSYDEGSQAVLPWNYSTSRENTASESRRGPRRSD